MLFFLRYRNCISHHGPWENKEGNIMLRERERGAIGVGEKASNFSLLSDCMDSGICAIEGISYSTREHIYCFKASLSSSNSFSPSSQSWTLKNPYRLCIHLYPCIHPPDQPTHSCWPGSIHPFTYAANHPPSLSIHPSIHSFIQTHSNLPLLSAPSKHLLSTYYLPPSGEQE